MRVRHLLMAFGLSLALASPLHAQLASQADRSEALALFRAGQEYLSAEQFEKAIDAFSRAVQKDPLLSIAHYGIGQANMNLRRYARAAHAYTDCIEALRTVHGLQQAGSVEAEKKRDDEVHELRALRDRGWRGLTRPQALVAEQHLRDLETQSHDIGGPFRPPAETLLALGSAYFRDGDGTAAEVSWKAALEVNPKYGEAHNNLAVIYMQTGRLSDADEELKLARKNGFKVNPQFERDLQERQRAASAQ
ncbi:MAG TPA: tetratricopeptide repeat protein [Vicinamibacterales bacterium]|nr:tetratricopeptide repeat protein [Vicinamibacterales bacterium]